MSPSRAPSSPARKPPARATNADATNVLSRTKSDGEKSRRNRSGLAENKQSISPIVCSPKVRSEIEAQLFRLMGKRDPRAIPRIIHDRTGYSAQVICAVIQGTCKEYRAWRHEIELALARANETAAAVWQKRSA